MKEIFLLISDGGVCTFLPDETFALVYAPIDLIGSASDIAEQIEDGLGLDFRGKKLVLVANCKKTIVRIADAQMLSGRGLFRRKMSDSDAWEVIKSVFPIGPSINEETHLFDISHFGKSRYVCCGLPVDLCEKLAEVGKELTRNIHKVRRLETIENMMFAKHCFEDKIIVYPQDDSFRVLTVRDGLPENAFVISNHPDRREAEFERILACLGEKREINASFFTLLGADDDLGWVSKYE